MANFNPFSDGYNAEMAQQQQGFGLAQQLGALGGALGGQSAAERMWPPRENQYANLAAPASKPKPKTIREELQAETNEWLKDTI